MIIYRLKGKAHMHCPFRNSGNQRSVDGVDGSQAELLSARESKSTSQCFIPLALHQFIKTFWIYCRTTHTFDPLIVAFNVVGHQLCNFLSQTLHSFFIIEATIHPNSNKQ